MTLEQCRDACLATADACSEVAAACRAAPGASGDMDRAAMLEECARVCRTSADVLGRLSDLSFVTCRVCAELCMRCAAALDDAAADPRLAACATACRKCAEVCFATSLRRAA